VTLNTVPFYSTYDKSNSGKKIKNCYICRIKPIKIVTEMVVDIDDPNMLDKIDITNARYNSNTNSTSCLCSTKTPFRAGIKPEKTYLGDSNSNSYKQSNRIRNISNNKKFIPTFNSMYKVFNCDSTPNRYIPLCNSNTPGYGKYKSSINNNCENKMNYAK